MNLFSQAEAATLTSTFGVDQIADNTKTDFDLFLKIRNHIVLYGGAGYQWYKAELEELLSNGIKFFQVKDVDVPKAQMYLQMIRLPFLEKSKAPKERIKDIQSITATFTKNIYEGELTPACVEKAEEIAGAMVQCIKEDPKCIQTIVDLANHDHYTYYHSVRVATYATAIAFSMGIHSDEELQQIALGCLLHDIGKAEVPIKVINKVGSLTDDEWAQMRAHPTKGFEKIDPIIKNIVPREIVLHHHEKLDGSGYPDNLDSRSLMDEVQIACIADVFDALTSSRSYQKARSRFEALEFMKQKMVGPKLPAEAFRALITCLA